MTPKSSASISRILEVPGTRCELVNIRRFVRSACRDSSALDDGDRELHDILLAVNEAAANIVKHAYSARRKGKIRVVADVARDRVRLKLSDRGVRFDRKKSAENGCGLRMMRTLMDEVSYARDADGTNQLTLASRLVP